jgi:hypothetical protein
MIFPLAVLVAMAAEEQDPWLGWSIAIEMRVAELRDLVRVAKEECAKIAPRGTSADVDRLIPLFEEICATTTDILLAQAPSSCELLPEPRKEHARRAVELLLSAIQTAGNAKEHMAYLMPGTCVETLKTLERTLNDAVAEATFAR